MTALRIATRGSVLARWQAEHIAERLQSETGTAAELLVLTTAGDRFVDRPLREIGGKGLFVKEIEEALLDGRADLAVHSAKDLPGELPAGLVLGAFPRRADPRDALISEDGVTLQALRPGARVGTGSERRACQLRAARPDLEICPLRGNVDTRLRKLHEDNLDAVVLACAGLDRLGLDAKISERLSVDVMLPSVGQGCLAVETRDSGPARELIAALDDPDSRGRIQAERAFLARMGGDCHVPLAGFAERRGDTLWLRALLGDAEGRRLLRAEASAPWERGEEAGRGAADEILDAGGAAVLDELRASTL
jgi:hydroxymethylbilane synthase